MESDRLNELIESAKSRFGDVEKEKMKSNFAEKLKLIQEKQLNGNQNTNNLEKKKLPRVDKETIARLKKIIADRSLKN